MPRGTSFWDVREDCHFASATYRHSASDSAGFSLVENDPDQVIGREQAETDVVVRFRQSVSAYFHSELEWTGNENPFCTVRETMEFRNVDI